MLLETYLFDEVEVGINNLFGSVAGEDLNQEADDTLDDEGITLGLKYEAAIHLISL